ncbi:TPA: hypothetical protein UOJ11_000969 [Stenotrophomonas maltophilia]|nr:hypothetical protein [Stenotrophomonas maltophilia]
MERSHHIVDRQLFSDDMVARAAHRYTGKFGVELLNQGADLAVVFSTTDGSPLPVDLSTRFSRDLLDERIRASVRAETHGLQLELIRAALHQAQPSTAA